MLEYRLMTGDDIDEYIALRIAQLREEGATEDVDLAPALRDYYDRHLSDDTFRAWLAVEKPPYFSNPSGRIGLLSGMYTLPEYRRRGIGRRLLGRVVDEARAWGCGAVQITASDMGVLLYADFGFVKNGNFMQYKL